MASRVGEKVNWDNPWDNRCHDCGSHFKPEEEIAEVVRFHEPSHGADYGHGLSLTHVGYSYHALVHVSCMKEGEQVA